MKRKILGTAAALVLAPLTLSAQEDLELLKQQTVQITVKREDGARENGSGVILCQVESIAYILTAHHVYYGQSHDGRNYKASDNESVEIRFYNDRPGKILETMATGQNTIVVADQLPDKDLLLLTTTVGQKLAQAIPRNPPKDSELRSKLGRDLYGVTAVGLNWATVSGFMKGLDDTSLRHSAKVEKGYSGGPLFDEAGGLVGINVRYAPASSGESEDPAGRTSYAVTLQEVEKGLNLPPGCIESLREDNSEELAHEKYREAMRYFNLGRWADAIELLKQAKDLKPTEGGRRVHLQGMRYTEYLPRYHLGVALFRKHSYEKAYDELLASFLSGQIKKGDKRYKKLIYLKSEAFERRNEEQPAGS